MNPFQRVMNNIRHDASAALRYYGHAASIDDLEYLQNWAREEYIWELHECIRYVKKTPRVALTDHSRRPESLDFEHITVRDIGHMEPQWHENIFDLPAVALVTYFEIGTKAEYPPQVENYVKSIARKHKMNRRTIGKPINVVQLAHYVAVFNERQNVPPAIEAYRALLGYPHKEYKQVGILKLNIEMLRQLVASFPPVERPRVAFEIANNNGNFIRRCLDKPIVVSLMTHLATRDLDKFGRRGHRIYSLMPAQIVHDLWIRLPQQEFEQFAKFINYAMEDPGDVDVAAVTNKLIDSAKRLTSRLDYNWIEHLVIAHADDYFKLRDDCENAKIRRFFTITKSFNLDMNNRVINVILDKHGFRGHRDDSIDTGIISYKLFLEHQKWRAFI